MGDLETEAKIMAVKLGPEAEGNRDLVHTAMSTIKALGRQVKNFNQELWNQHKMSTVRTAIIYKFAQNDGLRKLLLSTSNDFLVEASPYDSVWGIGLSETDAPNTPFERWGQNLLGKLLMEVRKMFATQGRPNWAIEMEVKKSLTREDVVTASEPVPTEAPVAETGDDSTIEDPALQGIVTEIGAAQ